jgi:hypothetical protein
MGSDDRSARHLCSIFHRACDWVRRTLVHRRVAGSRLDGQHEHVGEGKRSQREVLGCVSWRPLPGPSRRARGADRGVYRNPRDAETAAHIGFSHVWRLSEQARLETQSATITDEIVLARKYFSEAMRLAPDYERFKGFLAGMELAEGSVHGDEKLTRRGYFDLIKAKEGWPEFNLFTAGYILSRLPFTDSKYADGTFRPSPMAASKVSSRRCS